MSTHKTSMASECVSSWRCSPYITSHSYCEHAFQYTAVFLYCFKDPPDVGSAERTHRVCVLPAQSRSQGGEPGPLGEDGAPQRGETPTPTHHRNYPTRIYAASAMNVFASLILTQVVTGQEDCVEALLQRGANVCARDLQGHSPLHLASACGRVAVLGALLQASSPSHAHLTDNQGYTPLHWACYNGAETLPTGPAATEKVCTRRNESPLLSFQVTTLVWRCCWIRKCSSR